MRSNREVAMLEFQAGYTARKAERALQAAADRASGVGMRWACSNSIVWGK
jgi:hypothetical protein